MPVVKRESFDLAVHNIARYGDTDVFPFPLENLWFHDDPESVITILEKIDATFDSMLAGYRSSRGRRGTARETSSVTTCICRAESVTR